MHDPLSDLSIYSDFERNGGSHISGSPGHRLSSTSSSSHHGDFSFSSHVPAQPLLLTPEAFSSTRLDRNFMFLMLDVVPKLCRWLLNVLFVCEVYWTYFINFEFNENLFWIFIVNFVIIWWHKLIWLNLIISKLLSMASSTSHYITLHGSWGFQIKFF